MRWCPTMRRKRVRHVRFGVVLGREIPGSERIEWRTEQCDTPLFSDDGAACKSCVKGWAEPTNFPISRAPEFFDRALEAGDPLAAAAARTAGADIYQETLLAAGGARRALATEM